MQLTEITTAEYLKYVPCHGWDGVEAALTAYGSGRVNGSHAAQKRLYDDIYKTRPGMGPALIGLASIGIADQQKSDFVGRIIEEAKPAVSQRGLWSESYEYNAMGTAFFKTCVTIVVLDSEADVYGISLSAAYVGNQPEANLATYFGVDRCIMERYIDIKVAPASADSFTFDFETILRKLDGIIATSTISGKEVAAAMLTGDGTMKPYFPLAKAGGFAVSVNPQNIGDRMRRIHGELVDQWSMSGSCLSGKLERDWGSPDKDAKEKPTLRITVKLEGASDYGHDGAIWKTPKKREIIALSNMIAETLH